MRITPRSRAARIEELEEVVGNTSPKSGESQSLGSYGRLAIPVVALILVLLGNFTHLSAPAIVHTVGRTECRAGSICTLQVSLRIKSADPVIFARVEGPSTIIAPSSVAPCEPAVSTRGRTNNGRDYCFEFWPTQPGVHAIVVREEYDSLAHALREFAPDTPNPCFLGTELFRFANLNVLPSLSSSSSSSSPPPSSSSSSPSSPVGHWVAVAPLGRQPPPKGMLGRTEAQMECPAFFAPLVISQVVEETTHTTISLKQAHHALFQGTSLWLLLNQTRGILSEPAVAQAWAASHGGQQPSERDIQEIAGHAESRLDARWASKTSRYRWVPGSPAGRCERAASGVALPASRRDGWLGDNQEPWPVPTLSRAQQCLRDASPITFATDSVGRYLYHYLVCSLRLSFPSPAARTTEQGGARGEQGGRVQGQEKEAAAGGSMPPPPCNSAESRDRRIRLRHVPSHGLTCPRDPKVIDVVRRLHAEKGRSKEGGTLVVNPGVWDAGYGYVDGYEERLGELRRELEAGVEDGAWDRVVFLSVTDAHPINYPGVRTDVGRQYLTSPRTEALSQIQRKAIGPGNQGPCPADASSHASSLIFVDLFNLTHMREDDPLTPTDMRHYGPAVTREMAVEFMRRLCPNV